MFDQEQYGRHPIPARTYRRPMDVVEAAHIALREKLAILKAWEADERKRSKRAEDEGMGGGEHAHLQRVQQAISHVQQTINPLPHLFVTVPQLARRPMGHRTALDRVRQLFLPHPPRYVCSSPNN